MVLLRASFWETIRDWETTASLFQQQNNIQLYQLIQQELQQL